MGTFNEADHPRGTGGKWAEKQHAEPDVTLSEPSLTADTSFPLAPPPLTPRDVERLIENKGRFADGYDNDTINKVLGGFDSANLVCVWDYFDDAGYGGNSEIVGIGQEAVGPATQDRASTDVDTWRRLHPDAWAFLSDPESDIDPESIPSLLDTDGEFAVYEMQNIDELPGDGFRNVAAEYEGSTDSDTCSECDASLDDNEGYDGYCGTCADKIERHNEDEHEGEDSRDPDCPNCNGARVSWG